MANDSTLEDYYAAWQRAADRRRVLGAAYLVDTGPLRDAITDEEYARTMYFRARAEQEGEA